MSGLQPRSGTKSGLRRTVPLAAVVSPHGAWRPAEGSDAKYAMSRSAGLPSVSRISERTRGLREGSWSPSGNDRVANLVLGLRRGREVLCRYGRSQRLGKDGVWVKSGRRCLWAWQWAGWPGLQPHRRLAPRGRPGIRTSSCPPRAALGWSWEVRRCRMAGRGEQSVRNARERWSPEVVRGSEVAYGWFSPRFHGSAGNEAGAASSLGRSRVPASGNAGSVFGDERTPPPLPEDGVGKTRGPPRRSEECALPSRNRTRSSRACCGWPVVDRG